MKFRSRAVVTAVGLLGFFVAPARASFDGAAVTVFYDDPARGTHVDTRVATVTGGFEAAKILGTFDVDVSARRFTISTTLPPDTGTFLPAAPFGGFNLFDSGNDVPPITGVSIDPATNLTGLTADRVSFDANNIFVNIAGLEFRDGSAVVLIPTFDSFIGNFNGADMTLFTDFPALGTHVATNTFTVVGAEAAQLLGGFDVDIRSSQIEISATLQANDGILTPSGREFSGVNVFDSGGSVPDITSVTINPRSNVPGFNASRLSFDANNVYADFQDMTFRSGARLLLDVTFAPAASVAAPEPGSLALVALVSGAGLAFRKGRRRTRGVTP
jgi:hypothetical protein